jgi:hypothetical protein
VVVDQDVPGLCGQLLGCAVDGQGEIPGCADPRPQARAVQSERTPLLERALIERRALPAAASEQEPAVPVGGAEDDPDQACGARARRGVAMGGQLGMGDRRPG